MPTGSGKTAVLIASAFVLRAKRVLIVAPSRLVREQITDEIASLKTLRDAGAVEAEMPNPTVFATKKRITDPAEWEAMREFDVVVGTIQSISSEYAETPSRPPTSLIWYWLTKRITVRRELGARCWIDLAKPSACYSLQLRFVKTNGKSRGASYLPTISRKPTATASLEGSRMCQLRRKSAKIMTLRLRRPQSNSSSLIAQQGFNIE